LRNQYREQALVTDTQFGYAFGDIMTKRHFPAVKFDPPNLSHPRTIDDPLAMTKPVSLDELCKDGKPIYIAVLRVDEDFIPTMDY